MGATEDAYKWKDKQVKLLLYTLGTNVLTS